MTVGFEVCRNGRFAHVNDPVGVGSAIELTGKDQPVHVGAVEPQPTSNLGAAKVGRDVSDIDIKDTPVGVGTRSVRSRRNWHNRIVRGRG